MRKKKKKASTLEEERFNCHTEEIEVYESSSHEEKKKPFQDAEKNEHFLYILPLHIMPTMRQKKKKSIFKLFHPRNKTTENLNLRIKEATSRILKKNVNLHFHLDDDENIFDVPSKKNWIIDY